MRDFLHITKAMSDENRVRALMALVGGELCLCQLIELLGLAPSTVSKHMSVLWQAGLVETRKEGRWMYYRLPGRRATAFVRAALRWVRNSLAEDEQMIKQDKRLQNIRKMSLERLCSHYRR